MSRIESAVFAALAAASSSCVPLSSASRRFRRAALAALAAALSSCVSMSPPYEVSDVRSEGGAATFSFTNLAAAEVSSLALSLVVEDGDEGDGEPVLALVDGGIPGGSSLVLAVPLPESAESLPCRSVSAVEIRYADGTVWRDPFGSFSE